MNFSRLLPLLILAALAPGSRAFVEIRHVIAISVDGLRGDFLQGFVNTTPAEFPNFIRLREMSAFTYNARCDFAYSETVPNHLAMVTGRPVLQPGGQPAAAFTGFTNNFPTATDTVHVYAAASGTNSGSYKAGIFDVAHDRGLSTALYLGKTRLEIVRRSFNAANGAPDVTGPDNGRNKIDFAQVQDGGTNTLIATLVAHIASSLERFTLLHITDPDTAGHSSGWTTTIGGGYRNSILTVDGYVGAILNALAANPALAGRVAVLLTGDHGGGGLAAAPNAHTDATQPGNYTIPFYLFAPGVAGGSDLHALFENRVNPGTTRPTFLDAAQPVHNADIANLSAALLGLPSVPGSFLPPELLKPVQITRNENGVGVTWPAYLTGWALEFSDNLDRVGWHLVSPALTDATGHHVHTVTGPVPENRFFRLRRP